MKLEYHKYVVCLCTLCIKRKFFCPQESVFALLGINAYLKEVWSGSGSRKRTTLRRREGCLEGEESGCSHGWKGDSGSRSERWEHRRGSVGRQGAVSCEAHVQAARRGARVWEHSPVHRQGRRVRELLPGAVLCLRSEIPVVGAGMDSLRRWRLRRAMKGNGRVGRAALRAPEDRKPPAFV